MAHHLDTNKVLTDRRFSELCGVLGVKEQCCLDPDKRVIEKAFRRSALKCHPDKGGDPVVFKRLNDAYYKLIGHITKVNLLGLLPGCDLSLDNFIKTNLSLETSY